MIRCTRSNVRCVFKRALSTADAAFVIELNRLHGNGTFFVNPDLIEVVEAKPDTVITMVNKHRYIVDDAVAVVVDRIVAFRVRIAAAAGAQGDHAAGARSMALLDDNSSDDQEQAA